MTCTQCGAALTADDVFCPKCGARQAAGVPVPSDPLRAALERAVAIKILPPETAADADSRERFRREARTAAKLTHPNIVPLHSFGDAEGMLYFVMGYVRGESLAERMRREGKLPEEDVRRILAEVADALHYAHKQGVVHRDIKPDNILIDDESGRPMLTDFGVAKARASGATLTEAGAVVGTPYYMSPEQASGVKEIDGRSDLYSLGVMGYAMLSGRLPFEGESFRDVILKHMTQEPAPLAALVPDAPPDLAAAVMRCLAKKPAARWRDGRSMRNAVDVAGDEDAELALPVSSIRSGAPMIGALLAADGVFAWLSWALPGLRAEDAPWWGAPALLAGTLVILPSIAALTLRRKGFSWSALRHAAIEPPRWWPFWYPRRWRAPADLWDRLPAPIRRARAFVAAGWTLILGSAALTTYGWYVMVTTAYNAPPILVNLPLIPFAVAVALQAVGALGAKRFGLDRGLTVIEAGRFGFTPTMRPEFWRKPKYAALLLPPAGQAVARAAEPHSPEEYAQAIRDVVGQLPSGTQATVSEAADAARQLLGTVAALDAELAKLAQDADPQELEAVEAKLRALGPETPDEGEVRRQKRAALVPQHQLLRELNRRLAEATDRRTRLLDLMRTMWLQVATPRAEAARDTLAVTEISGRIKALCTEIDAHVQAAETVRVETS